MNPLIAFFLCISFIVYFVRRDLKNSSEGSSALWLPSLFLLVVGSRPVSYWLNPSGLTIGAAAPGANLLDTFVTVSFLIGGFTAVSRRPRSGVTMVSSSLLMFLGYCGLSLVWSDGGLQAAKQYIKLLGMIVMAVIIASESDQVRAITTVMRRCAYILIPCSFLFIKYYPEYGMRYDQWSGAPMYFGVADDKNRLGQLCMVTGLVMMSSLLIRWTNGEKQDREGLRYDILLILLTVYLLIRYTDSVTSIICWTVGTGLLVILKSKSIQRNIGGWLVSAALIVGIAQFGFGLSAHVARAFGRDPNLTNRTVIWGELLGISANPIFGTGYEGFWNSFRQRLVLQSFRINEAHNGFLEIYLNLGIIGLMMFCWVLYTMYKKCRVALTDQDTFGRFAFPIWVSLVVYNITESGWKGLSMVLFLSLFIAVQPEKRQKIEDGLFLRPAGNFQELYSTTRAEQGGV